MLFVDMAAGLLMGTLSGMGVGGGGLLVIYLTMLRGAGQISAQGVNLYFFIFASAAALFVHSVKRNINWRVVLVCSAFGMVAAFFGSAAAAASRPELLRKIFGGMLIAAGGTALIRNMIAKSKTRRSNAPQ